MNKKYLSIKTDNTYLVYLNINEYKTLKDKEIFIGNNKIDKYKYDTSTVYNTGYIVLSIENKGNDIEEVKIMIINNQFLKKNF